MDSKAVGTLPFKTKDGWPPPALRLIKPNPCPVLWVVAPVLHAKISGSSSGLIPVPVSMAACVSVWVTAIYTFLYPRNLQTCNQKRNFGQKIKSVFSENNICKSKVHWKNITKFFVIKFGTKWCVSHFSATFLRHCSKSSPKLPGFQGVQDCGGYRNV